MAVPALVLAFAANQAAAAPVGNFLLNVSGKAQFPSTDYYKGTQHIVGVTTKSFSESDIYALVSNAVAKQQ